MTRSINSGLVNYYYMSYYSEAFHAHTFPCDLDPDFVLEDLEAPLLVVDWHV